MQPSGTRLTESPPNCGNFAPDQGNLIWHDRLLYQEVVMSKPSAIIQVGKSQKFQYRGELIPNQLTITKAAPGPAASQFRVQSGGPGWTLYGAVPGANVQLMVNWPNGEGTVYCDAGSEIQVSGDGIFPV
jgi:hypothetical protein